MPTAATRKWIIRWAPFAVVVVFNTAVSLSTSVTGWWAAESTPGTSRLPAAADPVLRARADTSNADVHTILWFMAALALVWAMRSRGWQRLVAAAVALWVYTGLLEVAQRWVPTRTSQWIDVAGNGLGIAAGLAVGCGALASIRWLRDRKRSGPATAPNAGRAESRL